MVWKTSKVEALRLEFVHAVLAATATMSALCRQFGITRPTGYKWLARFDAEGERGLKDRPPKPLLVPHRLADETRELLLEMRREHPTWGSKKLLAALRRRHPRRKRWPARSTVDALLKREGLLRPRRRRARVPRHTAPLAHAVLPNDLWCMDFKGDLLLGSGKRCYPLTITDAATRFVLCCRALPSTSASGVIKALRETFARHGLPRAMRSDNGTPFATTAPRGLSQVGVLLHRLGIAHERIEPGHPEQNGQHERFHLTLQRDACEPAPASLLTAQRGFDRFSRVFNHERPHEALAQNVPSDFYERSEREMPVRLPEPNLAGADHLRRVGHSGHFKWRGHQVFVTGALVGERLGFFETERDIFEVRFGDLALGHLHDVRGKPELLRATVALRPRAPVSRTA